MASQERPGQVEILLGVPAAFLEDAVEVILALGERGLVGDGGDGALE